MAEKRTFSQGGQQSPSERRGERSSSRQEDNDRERQFQAESLAHHAGYIRAGGGYLIRRKKIGGD